MTSKLESQVLIVGVWCKMRRYQEILLFTTIITYSLSRKLRVGFGMTSSNFLAGPLTWVVTQLEGFLFFLVVLKLFCIVLCFFCCPLNQQISGYNFKNSIKYKVIK